MSCRPDDKSVGQGHASARHTCLCLYIVRVTPRTRLGLVKEALGQQASVFARSIGGVFIVVVRAMIVVWHGLVPLPCCPMSKQGLSEHV